MTLFRNEYKGNNYRKDKNTMDASLTRTLQNLYEKQLIDLFRWTWETEKENHSYAVADWNGREGYKTFLERGQNILDLTIKELPKPYVKAVKLTPQGIEKAKQQQEKTTINRTFNETK